MKNSTNTKPRSKGHQTFILRDGWLNKGLVEMSKDGNERIFNASDATDVFGIGTNMVAAMKYWLQAFNVIQDKSIVCFINGEYRTALGTFYFFHRFYLLLT